MRDLVDRLILKTAKLPNGCIVWTGGKRGHAYGAIALVGRRHESAHRVAYEAFVGAIPKSLQVLHTCDNRICVNPTHLFLGTHLTNMQDKSKKGRQSKGVKHGKAKLTEAKVREIRRRKQLGESVASIARAVGATDTTVYDVLKGNSWSHLQ